MDWLSWELVAVFVAMAFAGHLDMRTRRLESDNTRKTKQIEWLQGECRSLRNSITGQAPAAPEDSYAER